jgi:transcriptional regulator with XRE-family HTH domain
MKRTTINAILIQDRILALVKKHGGTRAAARVLRVDPSYVSRLCNGGKTNPSDSILKHLGLVRSITYIDDGSEDQI